jgi:hypothetical protein
MTSPTLANDARNRALRVFLWGLAYTVGTAAVVVLGPVFTSADGFEDIEWSRVLWSLVQAVVVAAIAYLGRTVLDPSRFPTPLPPANPGEPDDTQGA